jgi:hypothetical protein
MRYVHGAWYGDQACSTRIWDSGILDGVKRCVASGKCLMGAKSVFLASTIEDMGYAVSFRVG